MARACPRITHDQRSVAHVGEAPTSPDEEENENVAVYLCTCKSIRKNTKPGVIQYLQLTNSEPLDLFPHLPKGVI